MSGRLAVVMTFLAGAGLGLAVSSGWWGPQQQALGQPAQKPAKVQQRWEYKVVAFSFDNEAAAKKMNELADDGWEYVGLVNTSRTTPAPGRGASVAFRRPKKEAGAKGG